MGTIRHWHIKKKENRPPLKISPHIDKCNGEWLCGIDDTIGYGSTPKEAYDEWCFNVAIRFLAYRNNRYGKD